MGAARTPAQIAQLIRHREDRGGVQKIRKRPRFSPEEDKRKTVRNKYKESFESEGV